MSHFVAEFDQLISERITRKLCDPFFARRHRRFHTYGDEEKNAGQGKKNGK